MKYLILVTLLALAGLQSGCVNPYAKFYQGIPDARTLPTYLASAEPLRIFSTDNFDRDLEVLSRKGYMPVGNASFQANSDAVSDGQLREQAQIIGAAAVLISSKYSHTVTGVVPMAVPTTSQSHTTGSATAFGSGGTATVVGSATTTTYSSQTVALPYSIDRANYGAVFLVRTKARLGIVFNALDDASRKRLETNYGLLIKVVVEDSPAFKAEILPGDILLELNGERLGSAATYHRVFESRTGPVVSLKLDRRGKMIEKQVEVGWPAQ